MSQLIKNGAAKEASTSTTEATAGHNFAASKWVLFELLLRWLRRRFRMPL